MQLAQKLLSTRGGTIALSAVAGLLAAGIFLVYLHRTARASDRPPSR